MNVVLEWLLATRATMDSWQKELELNAELTAHLNEAQAIEATKEVEYAMQPPSWRLRCIMQPLPVFYNRPTGRIC